jgi:predicted TIM-barrel fold metal-dependent hydrolase
MPFGIKILDTWVNPNPPEISKGRIASDYWLFPKEVDRLERGVTEEEFIEEMDASEVEKGLLCASPKDPFREAYSKVSLGSDLNYALKLAEKYPDRFSVAVRVQPRDNIQALRNLEYLVKNHNVVAAKVSAHSIGAPYTDKMYWPVYTKCIELGIPITVNVGFPAPKTRAEYQNPIYLDEVCETFPELRIVMTHIGDPWVDTVVVLLLRWPNLFLMTSAFYPKYYPQKLLDFMNTRGGDKVMFASDYPLLSMRRCVAEVQRLPLREHLWPKFLRENAAKVFDWNARVKSGAPFD